MINIYIIFGFMTLCNLVGGYRLFGETYFDHLSECLFKLNALQRALY